jgi:hypothetical protein
MKVQCPNCGESVAVKGIGRKPKNIPLKNVCDAIQTHRSVVDAAQELGCSPAYIFGVLKTNDLKVKDVLKELS